MASGPRRWISRNTRYALRSPRTRVRCLGYILAATPAEATPEFNLGRFTGMAGTDHPKAAGPRLTSS